MHLFVEREPSALNCTHGKLYLNGEYFCETLEDVIREVPGKPVAEWKIPGETAIPIGTYKIVVRDSPHFKRSLPLLLSVPGFEDIEIHPGNTARDTHGCLLLGESRTDSSVSQSVHAFERLFTLIEAALAAGDAVDITYSNPAIGE